MDEHEQVDRPAGLAWRNYFRASLQRGMEVPIRDGWAEWEREVMGPSLAQFQLGESSDGRHLLEFARRFGSQNGDAWLGEAMALFIQEENRHSHWLGEFLKAQEYPLLRHHWADEVFRFIRKPLGFGLMAGVLMCAEVVAVPYYSSVRYATASVWLRAICDRILGDEAQHLRFQADNLGAVWRRRSLLRLYRLAHRGLMTATCLVVWREHGRVLRGGGYTLASFTTQCLTLLDGIHAKAQSTAQDAKAFAGGPHGLGEQERVGGIVQRIGT